MERICMDVLIMALITCVYGKFSRQEDFKYFLDPFI